MCHSLAYVQVLGQPAGVRVDRVRGPAQIRPYVQLLNFDLLPPIKRINGVMPNLISDWPWLSV